MSRKEYHELFIIGWTKTEGTKDYSLDDGKLIKREDIYSSVKRGRRKH